MENNQDSDPSTPAHSGIDSSGFDTVDSDEQTDVSDSSAETAPSVLKQRIKRSLVVCVVVLGFLSGAMWFAVYQAQRLPEFYAQVLEIDNQTAKIQGRLFERNLIRLQNASRRVRPWNVEFTQDQMNGWFSADLPEKFPEAIPRAISAPRVKFDDQKIRLGFRYDFRGAGGYVVVNAEIFCTDTPNEIAIKVSDVRTGIVPLPIGPWMEKVADSIRDAGIPVFWSRNSGTPVAVFTIPETVSSKSTNHVVVEAIELKAGKLILSGTTIETQITPEGPHQKKVKPSVDE